MLPTLRPGDVVGLATRPRRLPRPGEVVVVRDPERPESLLIKRTRSRGEDDIAVERVPGDGQGPQAHEGLGVHEPLGIDDPVSGKARRAEPRHPALSAIVSASTSIHSSAGRSFGSIIVRTVFLFFLGTVFLVG